MRPLFAPWRHAWVTSSEARGDSGTNGSTGFAGGDEPPACLFCSVWSRPAEDAANLVVHRGARCFVMLNRYPYNGGHLLVAPVEHRGAVEELSPEARAEMMELAARATTVLSELYGADGYNLGINQGRAAGAGIPDHVHLHVVPRWNGDTNFMSAVGDTRVISTDLARTRDEVAGKFRG